MQTKVYKPYCELTLTEDFKLVNCSDTHLPYVSKKALDDLLRNRYDADYVLINGDVLDCANPSRHEIYKVDQLATTYGMAVEMLTELSKVYKKVYVCAGNHDLRYERMLRRNVVTSELLDVLGGADILERICDEAGVEYSRNGFKINNVAFFHPDTYLRTPLSTARRALEYLLQFDTDLTAVSIGHTHVLGHCEYQGRLLFESGKMCGRLPYELWNRNLNWHYTRLGYIVFEFRNSNLASYTFVDLGE